MICSPGQTDINWATSQQLAAALGVASPIAQRVASYRPYLGVRDLGVVEGIGPERLRSILATGRMCATPTVLPPPSTEACASPKVDLQSASAEELVARLRINKNAAQRLVEARPFAQMRHVTPERVPGVGKGILQDLIEKSCLTPAPVRTGTSSFRWAYSNISTTVERDSYALSVPAGTLLTTGAWLSITPVAPNPGPTADFHIHGSWNGSVDVTLPADTGLPDGWDEPIVLHNPSNWTEIWSGPGISRTAGRVTVTTDSLSEVGTTNVDPTIFPLGSTDLPQTQDQFIEHLVHLQHDRFTGRTEVEFGGCADTPYIITNAFLPPGQINCSRALVAGKVQWTITNDTGDTLGGLIGSGATAYASLEGGLEFVRATGARNDLTAAALEGHAAAAAAAGMPITVPPGASLTVQLGPNSSGRLAFDDDLRGSLFNFALSQLGAVWQLAELTNYKDTGRAACVSGVSLDLARSEDIPYRSGIDCFIDLSEEGLTTLPQTPGVTKALKAVRALKQVNKYLAAADLIQTVSDIEGFDGSYIDLEYRTGTNALPDGAVVPPGVAPGFLVRDSNHDVYFMDTSTSPATARWVKDGGVYTCLGLTYPVVWDTSVSYYPHQSGSEAVCPTAAPVRDLDPNSISNEVLMRSVDGTLWIAEPGGTRERVPNELEFNCFADPDKWGYYTWDFVSVAEVEAFAWDAEITTFCATTGF